MPIYTPPCFGNEPDDPELLAQNRELEALQANLPEPWLFAPEVLRQARRDGKGILLPEPQVDHARVVEVPGRLATVPVRLIAPLRRPSRGVFMYIHGGGWVLGQSDFQDQFLARLAEATGLTAASVGYRLAPEHPYPAAPDDCEAVALWLAERAKSDFGGAFMAIGGESAGGHLSAVTLLRLRDRHQKTPFAGAVLNAGCFDLGKTPSARAFGERRLILRTSDLDHFVRRYLAGGGGVTDPDISPLYAHLHGLPPAHFTCGTHDALLDDTLFMSARWAASGARASVDIVPGGCHVFTVFPSKAAERSVALMEAFLNDLQG